MLETQCYRWLHEPEQAIACQLSVAPGRLHCKKSHWSAHSCLSECAALVQVLESDLATSQQQSTCIQNDLKSEAAHVRAQLEAECMATRQQLDRVEEAQKTLAQQQQTRIQVRATCFCSPQPSRDPGIFPCPQTFCTVQSQLCFREAYHHVNCQSSLLAALSKTILNPDAAQRSFCN